LGCNFPPTLLLLCLFPFELLSDQSLGLGVLASARSFLLLAPLLFFVFDLLLLLLKLNFCGSTELCPDLSEFLKLDGIEFVKNQEKKPP